MLIYTTTTSTLFQHRIMLISYFIASNMVQTHLGNKKNRPLSSAKVAPSKTHISKVSPAIRCMMQAETWQQLQKYAERYKQKEDKILFFIPENRYYKLVHSLVHLIISKLQ